MTVKEYIDSKSLNVTFTTPNIQGLLLAVEEISDCVQEKYTAYKLENCLEEDVREVLTYKGRDILLAYIYMLLATSTGNTETITRGSQTHSYSNSFGVNDRKDFREMAYDIFERWEVEEESPMFLTMRSSDILW